MVGIPTVTGPHTQIEERTVNEDIQKLQRAVDALVCMVAVLIEHTGLGRHEIIKAAIEALNGDEAEHAALLELLVIPAVEVE